MFTLVTGTKAKRWGRKWKLSGPMLQEQMTVYAQKVFQVTDYCTKLYHMTLPILRKADWIDAKVIEEFNEMKLVPEMWLNNGILEQLRQVPEGILSYNALYELSKSAIVAELKEMEKEPSKVSEEQRATLAVQIEQLAQMVGSLGSQAGNLSGKMKEMSEKIKEASTFFDEVYDLAVQSEKADQERSEELQREIDDLQKKIQHMNNSEIGMLSVETLAGVAAIVGTIKEIMWLQIVAATIVLLTTVTSFALGAAITSDVDAINQKRDEIDDYTYDLTLIGILKTELEETAGSVEAAQGAVTEIEAQWQDLKESLQALAQTIRSEEAQLDAKLYQEMIEDIEATETEWQAVVSTAEKVRLLQLEPDLKAEPVEIKIA